MAVVQMTKQDEALQEKMALEELLTCAGFKRFEQEFSSIEGCNDNDLKGVQKRYVNTNDLSKLNFLLGYAAALSAVKNVLQGYKDDLAQPSGSVKSGK